MTQVRITEISGGTYPIDVYISDVYGNYQTLLGTINTGPVPPIIEYNTVIPSIFNTAPEIMLTLTDNNGCSIFKLLQCTFGCTFYITIELVLLISTFKSQIVFSLFSKVSNIFNSLN